MKKTNGQDANSGTGPYIRVGQPVTWTYDVTNSGNVPLSNVIIKDDNGTPGIPSDDFTCPIIASLAAGATQTCTQQWHRYSRPVHQSTASVTGTPPVGNNVTASDPSAYFGANPVISLVKKTNGQVVHIQPPGLISWWEAP